MMRRERAGILAVSALTVGATAYSAWKLLGEGILSWHVAQPEFYAMAGELLAVWLLLFLLFFYGTDTRIRIVGALAVVGASAWLHVVFLPMLLSGIYVCYLTMLGRLVTRGLVRRKLSIPWDFMTGTAVTLTVFCLLSFLEQGSIGKLRIWVLGSGLLLGGWWLAKKLQKPGTPGTSGAAKDLSGTQKRTPNAGEAVMLSAILMLLLLQMVRMNGAVDFDSTWYGVRSAFMLDSGNGIYENLGTLGVVYTYPKGWETLTLPLAGLPSYSFPIAFNLWAAALLLAASYETACLHMSRRTALWVPFLMAAVPGIMNMSGTAKADIMTLLFQVLMVQGMLRYEKERRTEWLAMGLAAGGVSLTMKPTAVIFSTAIVGMGMLWILWDTYAAKHGKNHKPMAKAASAQKQTSAIPKEWLLLIPSAAALVGIWGRTYHLVGVPVTSVFYQVFQKLGFEVKYPFYASGFPSAGTELSWTETIQFFAGRLYGVLFNPQGDDMGHVIIAWGTIIPTALFLFWLAGSIRRRKTAGKSPRVPDFLTWLLPAVLVINLISLYALYQIDGNYYLLYYFLVILAGCMALERAGHRGWKTAGIGLLPAWIFAAVICCLTNWAWALGTGGMHPVNPGYYNHTEAERETRAAQGSGAIWDILAANPKNRVIALGEHPGVLTFPCSVQSYVDVSGYWGNPEVVSSAPEFLRYLHYAETDYLYMEREYVDASVRIYQIVRTLVEEGWLTDVRDENGSLILTVQKEAPDSALAVPNLNVFDTRYVQHP